MGARNLLLKNQYLLGLQHKSDEQNTFEQWQAMLRNRDVSGLTNSSKQTVPPIRVTEPTRTINRQSLTQQSFMA